METKSRSLHVVDNLSKRLGVLYFPIRRICQHACSSSVRMPPGASASQCPDQEVVEDA